MELWFLFAFLFIAYIIAVLLFNYITNSRKCSIIVEGRTLVKSKIEAILQRRPYIPSYISTMDYHGQLQTITSFSVRNIFRIFKTKFSMKRVEFSRQLLPLADGGLIGLDWAYISSSNGRKSNSESTSLVILQHGLCGSSESDYIIHFMEKLLDANFQVVAIVSRGCGGLDITTPTFVKRKTDDFREVLSTLRLTHPHVKSIYIAGYSLGAAMTLKFLGEEGSNSQITAAACISPPWNMEVETSVYFYWSYFIVSILKFYIYRHRDILRKSNILLSDVMLASNMSALDKMLIQTYGYKTMFEYYKDTSAIYFSSTIKVPTLAVSAADDPLCAVSGIPTTDNGEIGEGLVVVTTPFGGHCSFVHGNGSLCSSWTDEIIIDWFNAHRNKK